MGIMMLSPISAGLNFFSHYRLTFCDGISLVSVEFSQFHFWLIDRMQSPQTTSIAFFANLTMLHEGTYGTARLYNQHNPSKS